MENKITIDQFRGENFYLSNFYIVPIYFEKNHYKSSEHAYQARKAIIEEDRKYVASANTPGYAKIRARKIICRKTWDKIKVSEMTRIVYCKFSQNKELKKKLCDTGRAKLIEGNWWNDDFWGMVKNERGEWEGANYLGKILMVVRKKICIP